MAIHHQITCIIKEKRMNRSYQKCQNIKEIEKLLSSLSSFQIVDGIRAT
jgi:hypothetical protein